jgi:hypothetical protein
MQREILRRAIEQEGIFIEWQPGVAGAAQNSF